MKMSETKKKPEGAVAVAAPRRVSVLASLAAKLEIDPQKLADVLKKTAFAACRSDEEFIAMCTVANKYGLDPITKEIYAFPNKKTGAVIPVVGYDGWQKLANRNPQYDGCDFVEADDGAWCECRIYRKDRAHPIVIREWLAECMMETPAWQKYPRRMLRNKAFNQCARGVRPVRHLRRGRGGADHPVRDCGDRAPCRAAAAPDSARRAPQERDAASGREAAAARRGGRGSAGGREGAEARTRAEACSRS